MEKSQVARSRTAVLAVALALLAGCGTPDPTVDPTVAGHYQEFYDKGPSEPAAALAALEKAIAAKPDNAYGYYLRAAHLAAQQDLTGALAAINDGNAKPEVVVYVTAPPPEDSMQSLNRIRQLGFTAEKAQELGDQQPAYFAALRAMGSRVAKAEPAASLLVLNGTGVVRSAYKAEIAYWQEKGDSAQLAEVQEAQDAFLAWEEDMNQGVKEASADLIREAGKAAGMTEEQIAQYGAGKDIGDMAKMAKANEAKEKLYKREIDALRSFLDKMPPVD